MTLEIDPNYIKHSKMMNNILSFIYLFATKLDSSQERCIWWWNYIFLYKKNISTFSNKMVWSTDKILLFIITIFLIIKCDYLMVILILLLTLNFSWGNRIFVDNDF